MPDNANLDPITPADPNPDDLSPDALRAVNSRSRGPVAAGMDAAAGQDWFDLKDVAEAPVRGVLGAAQGAYGLLDTLTGDALPDWKDNPLGESTSVAGSVVEDIAKFSVGFVPVAGWLGKAAEIGGLAAKIGTVGRSAVAAAATGFALYGGHEKRLSDLVESVPALKNPLTDFLKSNPDDPEVVGRLKNAVEQAGAGAMFDALFLGAKRLIFGRKGAAEAIAKGASHEEAAAAGETIAEAAVPHSEIRAALEQGDAGAPSIGAPPEVAPTGDPYELALQRSLARERRATNILLTPERKAALDAAAQAAYPDLPLRDALTQYGLHPEVGADVPYSAADLQTRKMLTDAKTGRHLARNLEQPLPAEAPLAAAENQSRALSALNIDPAKVKSIIEGAATKEGAAPELFTPEGATFGPNPRNLSAVERLKAQIRPDDMNLAPFMNESGVPALLSHLEDAFLPAVKSDLAAHLSDPQALQDITDRSFKALGDIVGGDGARFQDQVLRGIQQDQDSLPRSLARVQSYTWALDVMGRQHVDHLNLVADIIDHKTAGNLELELLRASENLKKFVAVQFGVKGLKSEVGRALRGFQIETSDQTLEGFLQKSAMNSGFKPDPALDAVLSGNPKELAARVNELGGKEFLQKQVQKMRLAYGDGNTAALAKIARATVASRIASMTTEFWMSAILGAPKTFVVNVLSQSLNSGYAPLEQMMGSALVKGYDGATGNAIGAAAQDPVMRHSARMLVEMAHIGPEFLNLSSAMLHGEEVGFRPGNALLERGGQSPAITAANLGLDPESVPGKTAEFLGRGIRYPTKLLGGTDAVIKQVNFRVYARAKLYEEALTKGFSEPGAVAAYVTERMDKIILGNQLQTVKNVTQQGLKEAVDGGLTDLEHIQSYVANYAREKFPEELQGLSKEAEAFANDRTFTNKAEPGALSYSLQRLVGAHPYLRLVMPFINTPINLLKWTGQRLDAYGLATYMTGRKTGFFASTLEETKSRFFKDMVSGDPMRKAQAVGRLATGATLATTAIGFAANGLITGSGPKDPEERRALQESGWLPYAFKTPNGYVQFSRLDPVASIFGMAADLHDTAKHGMEQDQDSLVAVAHGIGVALANNITQKSYLAGIKNVVDVLTDPEKNLGSYTNRFAGSLVPGAIGAASGPLGDDYTREIRSMLDAIQARIPGLSDRLPPQRNVIGEPVKRVTAAGSDAVTRWSDFVLPVAYRSVSDDLVNRELGSLAYPFSPPHRTVNGVDLTTVPAGETNAYDRWGELHGSVKVNGMALKDALRREIKSSDYQRLEAHIVDGQISPRAERLNAIIRTYRSKAWDALLKEQPKLAAHDQAYTANKHRLRQGLSLSILPQIGNQ